MFISPGDRAGRHGLRTPDKPWYWLPPAADMFQLANTDGSNMTVSNDPDLGLIADAGTFSGTGDRCRRATVPVPASVWTLTAHFPWLLSNNRTDYSSIGLCVVDTVSSKQHQFCGMRFDTSGYAQLTVDNWNSNGSSFSSQAIAYRTSEFITRWLRVVCDGANLTFWVSPEASAGRWWTQLYSASQTAFLTNAPNRVGFFFGGNNVTSAQWQACAIDYWNLR